jgi:ketosteroid isomerase-like protein
MSSANLDLVRSIFADWERGDYGWTEWAHPEIGFTFADGPAPGSWTGIAGMGQALRDFLAAWQEYRVEADEFRELDQQCILVLSRFGGRGKASGLQIEQMRANGASLFNLRCGKVTRLINYMDRDRALADLGLEG